MRTHASRYCLPAAASGCFILIGSTFSSADEAPRAAGVEPHIPNMLCKQVPSNQTWMPSSQWDHCVGTFTFQNGNRYRGEFLHGMRAGVGVLTIKYTGSSNYTDIGSHEPVIYVGNFRRGRLNGYGLLIGKSGVAYAGTFKDNIAQSDLTQKTCQAEVSANWTNCIGTYRFPDGNVYRGEFARGLPAGIGLLQVRAIGSSDPAEVRLPMPGIYVGQFKDGKLSGQGAVVMPHAGYFGTFSDNMFAARAALGDGLNQSHQNLLDAGRGGPGTDRIGGCGYSGSGRCCWHWHEKRCSACAAGARRNGVESAQGH